MILTRRAALPAIALLPLAVRRARAGQGMGPGPGIIASAGGGGGFFSDPYSSYTQYWVDGLNGSDSNPGTSQLSAKKTIAAGVALLNAPATCLNILNTATYTPTANIPIASVAGTSPTAQRVIRGLPSYTGSQLPQIVFGPGGGFYVNSAGNALANLTFWKLNISSSSSPTSGASTGLIQFLSGSAVVNLWIRYCKLHDLWASDLAAAVHVEGANSTGLWIDNCYMYNIVSGDGPGNDNGTCILDYQVPAGLVTNCDFSTGNQSLIYLKRCAPMTANNGWTIQNNKFHDYSSDCILLGEQGSGDTDGFFDTFITGNLFYGGANAIRQINRENTLQSSRMTIANNTFAQDMSGSLLDCVAMTAIDINSNVQMSTNNIITLENASPYINTISRSDYNAILTSTGQSWWMQRFASSGAQQFTSLATWKTAFSVSARPELSADPEQHSNGFTTSQLSANFPNYTSRDYTLAPGSFLKATGLGGIDPGYNSANCGPTWS